MRRSRVGSPGSGTQNGQAAISALPCVLLQVNSGAEEHVASQVKARDMRCYWPRYLVNLRHGGLVARSLFPGYLFVWASETCWPILRTLAGVRDFVRRGGLVELVPPSVVDRLRARQGPTGYIRIDGSFVQGQAVNIKGRDEWAGIYLGLSSQYKARVLFSMLGSNIELELFEGELAAP